MKKSSKVLAFILALILLIGGFLIYPHIRYGIKTYSYANVYIPKYALSDLGRGAYIIEDKETYDTIFTLGDIDVNFDKEMIILIVFSDNYWALKYFLDYFSVKDNTAKLYIRLEYTNKNGACETYLRAMAVKIRKIDVENVEVYEWSPYASKYVPLF